MNLFTHLSYREAIRDRVRAIRATRPGFNLKRLSELIPLQYTYFSKTLNDPKAHLSEDHLFRVCRILELRSEETEYLFLLRGLATSQDVDRKEQIAAQLERIRRSKVLHVEAQGSDPATLQKQMSYLFDPVAVLVHRSLTIPSIRKEPAKLCALLGISSQKLEEILRKLSEAGFLERKESGKIIHVVSSLIYFATDHPYTRTHQGLFRHLCNARLMQTSEKEKTSFMASFTADEETRAQIAKKFQAFINEVEALVGKASDKNVYQVNFDLFKWF